MPHRAKGIPTVKEIGERLLEVRKALGATQEQWAALAGIGQTGISRIENAKRGVLTKNLLALLYVAAREGGNLDYVFRGVGKPVRPRIATDRPEIADELRELADRLVASR